MDADLPLRAFLLQCVQHRWSWRGGGTLVWFDAVSPMERAAASYASMVVADWTAGLPRNGIRFSAIKPLPIYERRPVEERIFDFPAADTAAGIGTDQPAQIAACADVPGVRYGELLGDPILLGCRLDSSVQSVAGARIGERHRILCKGQF